MRNHICRENFPFSHLYPPRIILSSTAVSTICTILDKGLLVQESSTLSRWNAYLKKSNLEGYVSKKETMKKKISTLLKKKILISTPPPPLLTPIGSPYLSISGKHSFLCVGQFRSCNSCLEPFLPCVQQFDY